MATEPRHTRIMYEGKPVDAIELELEPLREQWNEYRCSDGSILKLKAVPTKVLKLTLKGPDGLPMVRFEHHVLHSLFPAPVDLP